MKMGAASVVKLIAVVIVGLFIAKVMSKWLKQKFPNKVTTALDNVVSAS